MLAEPELLGVARQRLRRHDGGFDLRLLPFGVGRILVEERTGDDEPENRIPQELERLVISDAARRVLRGARLVRERVLEQPAITEAIGDAGLKVVEFVA